MDPSGIAQARRYLERAKRAADALLGATELNDIREQWDNFLFATTTVYNKLKKGAQGHGKSQSWYGRIANARRKDELLRYLQHARDVEEHGLLEGTEPTEEGVVIGPTFDPNEVPAVFTYKSNTTDPPRNFKVTNMATGETKDAVQHSFRTYLKVVSVRDDRFGDTFDPPTSHQGAAVNTDNPANIAALAVKYLERLVAEAEKY